jgi:multiple antibiotic resistance protein
VTDFLKAALGLFAAVAPFGALPMFLAFARANWGAGSQPDRDNDPSAGDALRLALLATSVAMALLVAAALLAGPFLDFLDVSPESFQFGAGVVMMPLAFRLLLVGDSAPPPDAPRSGVLPSWLVPVAVPLLASPPAIIAAVSYSARFGEGTAVVAAAATLAASLAILACGPWLVRVIGAFGVGALGRLSGGLLAVIAVELAIDGVRSV